ncbi:hypothetical protein Y032_0082g1537 [Ancylostoma ceylanicum]|nr:hypothetical protein Y032_0082g1537 [Ancylostoma ceylanicum]
MWHTSDEVQYGVVVHLVASFQYRRSQADDRVVLLVVSMDFSDICSHIRENAPTGSQLLDWIILRRVRLQFEPAQQRDHLGTFQAHCQNQLIEELAMTALQATTLIPPAVARVIEENLPIGDEKATENTQHDAHRNVRGQFE